MDNKKKRLLEIGLGAIVIIVAIAMIFIYSEKNKPMDKNIEAIKKVVGQIFTGPDQEMVQLFQEYLQKLDMSVREPSTTNVSSEDADPYSKIDEKLNTMYAPYMTKEFYEGSFARNYWSSYYVYSTTKGYELKVNNINITQSEKEPRNYSFVIDLNYGPIDSDKKNIIIDGSAQFAQEEGKISYLQIFDNHGLNMELRTYDEPKKDIYQHDYIFIGENEEWTAEYKINGTVIFSEKDGTLEYESDSDGLLTVTYKGDLKELSSVKKLQISYEYNHSNGKLSAEFDKGIDQKVFTLSGGGMITNPDEVIKVTITLDDEIQILELVNELQPVHITYPPMN